jgi:hypothetical protein
MTKLPEQTDPTLEAVKAALMAKPLQNRNYVGASSIGDECARKLWYSLHREPQPSEHITAIEDGHASEAIMRERLQMVEGIEIWDNIDFEDGDFKGHLDGVIIGLLQAPKTPHVWEHKCTKNAKDFVKAKEKYGEKNALEKWDYTYFVQAQVYMHYMDLTRHYLTVCSPGSRETYSCRTEYQKEIALKYVDRAHKILEMTTEPERGYRSPDFYKCRWCDFREECWG